jgi:hypothetical protein
MVRKLVLRVERGLWMCEHLVLDGEIEVRGRKVARYVADPSVLVLFQTHILPTSFWAGADAKYVHGFIAAKNPGVVVDVDLVGSEVRS